MERFKKVIIIIIANIIFSLIVYVLPNVGKAAEVALTSYNQVRHFSPRYYYNEHNINYMGVTINNWTFSSFTNSFYEPTKMINYQWENRYTNYMSGFVTVAWVHGYSDCNNFITPLAGIRFGKSVGPQIETTLLPGAIAWGIRFVFEIE